MTRPVARMLLPLLPALAACADLSRPPIFPPGAAGEPIVQEQALLGLSPRGDAAAAQLLVAEGEAPRLSLLRLDGGGGGPELVEDAPPEVARAVAARVAGQGARLEPLLADAVAALWPGALKTAAALGFGAGVPGLSAVRAEAALQEGFAFAGSAPDSRPLSLRIAAQGGSPPAQDLLLSEVPGQGPAREEVVLARMPLAGRAVAPKLFAAGGVAWMLAGSVHGSADGRGGPLRRTIGLRRASLPRGEAELHDRRGSTHLRAGARASARREFERAVAADPHFADALYHAAAAAARDGDGAAALALLLRAAQADPHRVQVLGRDDGDLGSLRSRPEVRALLGL